MGMRMSSAAEPGGVAAYIDLNDAVKELGVEYTGVQGDYASFQRLKNDPITPEDMKDLAEAVVEAVRRTADVSKPVKEIWEGTKGIVIS